MSFDRIDRQFRPREIKLECAECGTTASVESRYEGDAKTPLCRNCYHARELDAMWAGYCC